MLSRDLSVVGATTEAADAQQAAVTALRQLVIPGAAQTVADLADAEHTLAVRLVEAGRSTDSAGAAEMSVRDYVLAAGLPGLVAGAAYCVQQLIELSTEMSHHLLVDPAADAQAAGVDVWSRLTPADAGSAAQLTDFAKAKHHLAVRQAEATRLTQAAGTGEEAVAAYLRAADAGADRAQILRELQTLARELSSFGLQAPAFAAEGIAAAGVST
jgi:hypothetical protein